MVEKKMSSTIGSKHSSSTACVLLQSFFWLSWTQHVTSFEIDTTQQVFVATSDGACGTPSCRNSSVIDDLCCFNAPGGTLLLTQFWDANPPTGPHDSWTLHGLWPDNCDGTYEAYCDDGRNYRNITGILQDSGHTDTLDFMRTYWKDYKGNDESFWQHEWGKHGTCVSTLSPSCYPDYKTKDEVPAFFDRAVELFKALPTYEWLSDAGIVPSTTERYTSAQIQAALSSHFDGVEVRLGCHYGVLNEVWYFHVVRGSVQNGVFIPTDAIGSRSTCPASGIRYLPKGNAPAPTHTTTSRASPTSVPTPGKPFSGRGSLHVMLSGSKKGCVISAGSWYTSGTCATFTASKDDESFTLKSSKGECAIIADELVCGRGVKGTKFQASDSKLLFNGSDTFYADQTPRGWQKSSIYTDPAHDLSFSIEWQQ